MFESLKYILPVWYFNLPSKSKHPYFVDINKIPSSVHNIKLDKNFISENSAKIDAAFVLLRSGYISNDSSEAVPIKEQNYPIRDEYYFIRKHFGNTYALYVLFIRIISGKSFLNEFKGYFSSKKLSFIKNDSNIKRVIKSEELNSKPFVSIIIPTLNRYDYLRDVLVDLSGQSYRNFEIIVVDQSDKFDKEFYKKFQDLGIKLSHLKQKGVWNARNYGIKNCDGDIIVFTEDDVRLSNEWLKNHLFCLEHFNCDISSGVLLDNLSQLDGKPKFKWADQLPTGNVAIKKHVFQEIGLFDMQFEGQRMGDGEFGLRCYLAGFKNISNSLAYCIDLKATTGGFREFGSWDAYRSKKIFGPRPVPSVLYLYRKYFGREHTYLALLKNIPPSIIPYKFKRNRKLLIAGSFLIIIFLPVLFYQLRYSWKLSSKKLKEGAKIEKL